MFRGDFWTSKDSAAGGAESSNIAFVWDLITLWWSCRPSRQPFCRWQPTNWGTLPLKHWGYAAQQTESGTYCKLYISFQQLDFGPAIGSVAVNPVFVFTRYMSLCFLEFPCKELSWVMQAASQRV